MKPKNNIFNKNIKKLTKILKSNKSSRIYKKTKYQIMINNLKLLKINAIFQNCNEIQCNKMNFSKIRNKMNFSKKRNKMNFSKKLNKMNIIKRLNKMIFSKKLNKMIKNKTLKLTYNKMLI